MTTSSSPSSERPDHIRSFVLRQSHFTAAQQRAIETLWPQLGVDFQAAPVDWAARFGRQAPLVLEIGFGMGVATIEIAKRLPEIDFIAVDVHGPGVGNLLKMIDEEGLNNIRVVRHDAYEVVKHMIASGSLHGVHIFFPDPWHKKRHHKRRLIQHPFLDWLLPALAPQGYLHLATDWQDYAEQMLTVLSERAELRNTSTQADGFVPTPDYRPETKFEARGLRLGHGVWDLVFEKQATEGQTA